MKISDYLTQEEVTYYTHKSDVRGFRVLMANGLIILALFTLVYLFPNPLVIIVAIVLLGGRQLGLAVLMHECGHRTLFKDPQLNDIFGHWFCAIPTMNHLKVYMEGHLNHHKHMGTQEDPDLHNYKDYPVDAVSFRRKVIRDITGQTGLKLIKVLVPYTGSAFKALFQKSPDSLKSKISTFLYNPAIQIVIGQLVIFVLISVIFAPWLYLIWIVSFLSTFMLFVRLRQVAEHANVPNLYDLDSRQNTRTTIPRVWERLTFAPNFVNYHLEHHYMAAVPCYRLKPLHQLLKARGAYTDTKIFYGYVSLFRHVVQ